MVSVHYRLTSQGSVTGPYAFIAYVSDCKVLGILNFLMKYADDFNLLVPENSDVPVEDEMKHIISWSKSNKLFINLAKCKELVFWRPSLNLNSCQVFCQMLYLLLVVNYWVYLLIVT